MEFVAQETVLELSLEFQVFQEPWAGLLLQEASSGEECL